MVHFFNAVGVCDGEQTKRKEVRHSWTLLLQTARYVLEKEKHSLMLYYDIIQYF